MSVEDKQAAAPSSLSDENLRFDSSTDLEASPQKPQSFTRPRQKAVLLGGLFALVTLVSAGAGTLVGMSLASPPEPAAEGEQAAFSLPELWRKGVRYEVARPINILLMGVDRVAEGNRSGDNLRFAGRSDTMLLVRLNPEEQTISMLSIPRDTLVEFPGRSGVTKVNHANLLGGPKLAAAVVSHNLQGVEVDRYVRFNTSAFRALVDLLGGVDVFVPQDMSYVDQTQDLHIDLKAGQQRLSGDQAEQFARFRSDGNGDIGRVQRQQVLLGALRDRLSSPAMLTKIPALITLIRTHVDTNLNGEEILSLTNFALGLERSDVNMVMLPGKFSRIDEYFASYWIPDTGDVSRIMQDYFEVTPSRSRPLTDRLTRAEAAGAPDGVSLQQTMRIAVQNASESPYSAQQMAQHLRDQGFERVYIVPDWPTTQAQTQIIAQRGDVRGARC